MGSKAKVYLPAVFKTFQGFDVVDLKENRVSRSIEVVLEKNEERVHACARCGEALGAMHDRWKVRARHLRLMGWDVWVVFYREKRFCPGCKKVRSEKIEWICDSSPHITMDLAWWLSRLSEATSVLAVSRLEGIDKEACYQVDKFILMRLLQGYRIPDVTRISVDEVYARSKKQMKKGEDRDDLFLTVITDMETRKVIWVSESRKKEALDDFFTLIGSDARGKILVVATDAHEGYSASVRENCPQATIVFDRFHIVQNFNEKLNDERKAEFDSLDKNSPITDEIGDLMRGKYKYVYLTKRTNRTKLDQLHIDEVMSKNVKIAKLEIIKEHFHRMFECTTKDEAQTMMEECFNWAGQCGANSLAVWLEKMLDEERLWNYFKYRVTTGISEGINRVIKGLKWQAYGYKDMF
ncbi:MAG: ISL3 family transposase, partial [Cryobacterium sp.]|nr:ISL3 family transposase [Oligoflexia bacterium]